MVKTIPKRIRRYPTRLRKVACLDACTPVQFAPVTDDLTSVLTSSMPASYFSRQIVACGPSIHRQVDAACFRHNSKRPDYPISVFVLTMALQKIDLGDKDLPRFHARNIPVFVSGEHLHQRTLAHIERRTRLKPHYEYGHAGKRLASINLTFTKNIE